MPTPTGSGKKHRIVVIVGHDGTKYVAAGGGQVERIGGRQSEKVKWEFINNTQGAITVTVGNFSPSPPCPIDATGCQLSGVSSAQTGSSVKFEAKLDDTLEGKFNYEIWVADGDGKNGNKIDPELQIDGKHGAAKALAIGIAVAALAFAAYWFLMR